MTTTVALDELRTLTQSALMHLGYDGAEVDTLTEVLLYSQLRGGNQGVVKLVGKGIPRPTPTGEISINPTSPTAVMINGNQHHSMIVVSRAADVCVDATRLHGVCVVGVNNTSTSSGAIGYYARRIAEGGCVGIVMASSVPTVAPHGSTEAVMGTNPIAVAVPNGDEPVVYDMTTAAMAYFGVVEAATAGRALAEGVAFDAAGAPTTDAKAALDGALLPFENGPRGSGLSVMVELLAGALVGAAGPGMRGSDSNWGHLVIGIDPGVLGGAEHLAAGVAGLAAAVHAARPLSDSTPQLPGERGDAATKAAETSGSVAIDEALLAALRIATGN